MLEIVKEMHSREADLFVIAGAGEIATVEHDKLNDRYYVSLNNGKRIPRKAMSRYIDAVRTSGMKV